MVAAACSSTADTTTTLAPPPTTTTTVAATTTTQAAPPTTATTTTQPRQDPWTIDAVTVNAYIGADMESGIEEILSGAAMIEATIVSIGDPDTGRWCCANPPFQVRDIEVLGGNFTDDTEGWLKGIEYQSLDRNLFPGDRVTIVMRDPEVAAFVFTRDGGLAHPAPQHQVDAIDAMRVREAQSAGGWDPVDYTPLRAVTDIWDRYHTAWWGSMDQRVALAVSGVPGYPVTCSAADLGQVPGAPEYPPASEGLPFRVAIARDEIVAASTVCDYNAILALPAFVDGDDTDLFWWSGEPAVDVFVEADRRFGAIRELVLALTNTAVASETVNAPDDSGASVDQTFYVWPSAAVILNEPSASGVPASELLGIEEAARVAALAGISTEALDKVVSAFDGYALFRPAIDEAGNWRFALTGD